MPIHRYVEILKLDVPTAASGKIWPKSVVAAAIQNLTYPVPGMVGMPTTIADLMNIPSHLHTHSFHDLYISGGSLYGEVEIFDSDLIDYVTATESTLLEAIFRVATTTRLSHDLLGRQVVDDMTLYQINALPGERLVTGEV